METRAVVISGFGINCENETAYAIRKAGGFADILHLNEILDNPQLLDKYNFLIFPGGFSFGDDLGSGKMLANKIKHNLGNAILQFYDDGKLIMGICNGFQVLVKMGLLPIPDLRQRITLTFNDSAKFEDRWVLLKFNKNNKSPFLKGIEYMSLPIRHGEGKLFAEREWLEYLIKNDLVAVQYASPDGKPTEKYPFNPNGSPMGIAGITDESGRIFGLMPHPEAFNHPTNYPLWTRKRPDIGEGLLIFRNVVDYFKRK